MKHWHHKSAKWDFTWRKLGEIPCIQNGRIKRRAHHKKHTVNPKIHAAVQSATYCLKYWEKFSETLIDDSSSFKDEDWYQKFWKMYYLFFGSTGSLKLQRKKHTCVDFGCLYEWSHLVMPKYGKKFALLGQVSLPGSKRKKKIIKRSEETAYGLYLKS